MTFIVDGTNGLTFPNSTVQASAGQVLQVVNATYATSVSNSTSTYADTGLTASITPKFSTSKILVITNLNDLEVATTGYGGFQIVRGSTIINIFAKEAGYSNNASFIRSASVSASYLDSPATTSATTYKIQFASTPNAASVTTNSSGAASSAITLMEIAQ